MSDNDTIFTVKPAEIDPAAQVTKDTGVTVPPELENLVGPDKKYATLELALKAIAPAQAHITVLESDNAELRAKLTKLEASQKSVDDVLAAVKEGQDKTERTSMVDPDSITERVLDTLNQREATKTATENLKASSDELIKKFGTKEAAQVALADKAEALGLPVTDLMTVAAKSPSAFLVYFDIKPDLGTPGPTGSINTAALNSQLRNTAATEGTYEWFKAQRKTRGDKWYFSTEATKARTDAITKMGSDKFFGRK